ncbi:MAG: hypothetical protein U5L05_14005 [Rubrivivax sp.]|nr:hypothetical protein [Rubrivivax sp.]
MAQQINLLDPALQPRRDWLDAGHGLSLLGLILCTSAALSATLQWQAGRAVNLPAAMPALPAAAAASAPGELQVELQRLRALEQHQQRVRAALASGAAGAPDGYTPYLKALSRQAKGSLWITGFAVAAEGDAIELEGQMLDAAVLPGYLRQLNAEERFNGRPFAQLQLRTLDEGANAGHTEFVLRSSPPAREAER